MLTDENMCHLHIHVCTQMYITNVVKLFWLEKGVQIPLAHSPHGSQRTTTPHIPHGNIGCQRLSIAKVENPTVTGFSGVSLEQRYELP